MENYGISFSEPKLVKTRNGMMYVQEGQPTEAFWKAWGNSKAAIKAAGWSVKKPEGSEEWLVTIWTDENGQVAPLKPAGQAQAPAQRAMAPQTPAGPPAPRQLPPRPAPWEPVDDLSEIPF
jgi:hypothetical protein